MIFFKLNRNKINKITEKNNASANLRELILLMKSTPNKLISFGIVFIDNQNIIQIILNKLKFKYFVFKIIHKNKNLDIFINILIIIVI